MPHGNSLASQSRGCTSGGQWVLITLFSLFDVAVKLEATT